MLGRGSGGEACVQREHLVGFVVVLSRVRQSPFITLDKFSVGIPDHGWVEVNGGRLFC